MRKHGVTSEDTRGDIADREQLIFTARHCRYSEWEHEREEASVTRGIHSEPIQSLVHGDNCWNRVGSYESRDKVENRNVILS